MPSFLSKLFRGKKKGDGGADIGSTSASKASSKKSRKSSSKKNKKVDNKTDNDQPHRVSSSNNNNNLNTKASADVPNGPTKPSQMMTQEKLRRPSNCGTSNNYSNNNNGSGSDTHTHVRVLSPRHNQQQPNQQSQQHVGNVMMMDSNNRDFHHHGHPHNHNDGGGGGLHSSLGQPPNQHHNSDPNASSNAVLKQHSSPSNHNNTNGNNSWGAGPVDLDESDLGSDTDENQMQSYNKNKPHHTSQQQQRLSVQQLHRFDMQQQKREATAQFYMPKEELTRFSAGHVPVPDDMNRSEASGSSFNLSTDAEDTEYENLKRRGVVPNNQFQHHSHHTHNHHNQNHNNTTLDSSHLSGVSSPTNYNTDGDNSIFPALQTDDEGAGTDRDSQVGGILPAKAPTSSDDDDDDDDPLQIALRVTTNNNKKTSPSQSQQQPHLLQQHHSLSLSKSGGGDAEDRAWAVSPNAKDGVSPFSSFQPPPTSPTQQQRRNFISPKVGSSGGTAVGARSPKVSGSNSKNNAMANTDFANFADFSNVTFPADTESWGAPKGNKNKTSPTGSNQSAGSNIINNKIVMDSNNIPLSPGRSNHGNSNSNSSRHKSSHSAADMTLSDILAQAKGKRSSTTSSHRSTGSGGGGGSGRRVSSSSVSSAPAITSKYLRQQHNLRSRHSSGGSHAAADNSNNQDGTTPVSDIIDSLEIANASRSSNASLGGGSQSKRDSSRAAKDRMRDRRRNSSSRRRDDNNPINESSDGSDQEASESWLFDEVTGALGPRGIAADLESLSGRSKSSSGNKSHKSHRSHRSHRSHGGRSSRRRKSSNKHHPSSGESVDSRGSRHSRSSRYSHRSTRSYLSQMSEQSRSVANDLLRLEMQLAMVGSQDNNAATVPGSSASVASRASRKSRSSARRTVAIARRNKVTIQAPSGKLGIILANKADSKGTVVSGVRSSSVLSEKVSPGDRIVAIDGEDVSLMTVSEITTIMARKSDFERTLTVLTTPKHLSMPSGSSSSQQADSRNGMVSPTKSKDYDSYHGRYHSSGGR